MFGSHAVEFEEWVVAVPEFVVEWVGLVAGSLVGGGRGGYCYFGAGGSLPVLIACIGLWYFAGDCFGELLEDEGFGFEAVSSDEKDLGGESVYVYVGEEGNKEYHYWLHDRWLDKINRLIGDQIPSKTYCTSQFYYLLAKIRAAATRP